MATEKPINRIVNDLNRALDTLNADLDRVAILSGALAGFSRPVPDYEPWFHHLTHSGLAEHKLDR